MRKTFKLMFLIFSSVLFIAKSWCIGNHYAYVSGNRGGSAFLTRYQIDDDGDFINPITQQISYPEFGRSPREISGIAIAPDHKYLYVGYSTGIIRVHLNDHDHTLDLHDMEYYPLVNDDNTHDKSLVVSAHDHMLYVITHAPYDRQLYSYEINQRNHDKLEHFKVVWPLIRDRDFPHAENATNAGISVANDGTIFVNTNVPDHTFAINVLRMDRTRRPYRPQYLVSKIGRHADVGDSKYIPDPDAGDGSGLLVMADKIGLATVCSMSSNGFVEGNECLRMAEDTSFNAQNYPTYDIDIKPESPTVFYFTSDNKVLKWEDFDLHHAPFIMPHTVNIPSKYIVIF